MKRKWIVLTKEIWRIKWNIDFSTFECTYLWRNCRDIWRTNLMNSLIRPFECPYLWRNYQRKLRTSIINTLLWSKMFLNKYVRKKYILNWRTVSLGTHNLGHLLHVPAIGHGTNHSSTYQTIFMHVPNMHVPKIFWFEWKSELNQTGALVGT